MLPPWGSPSPASPAGARAAVGSPTGLRLRRFPPLYRLRRYPRPRSLRHGFATFGGSPFALLRAAPTPSHGAAERPSSLIALRAIALGSSPRAGFGRCRGLRPVPERVCPPSAGYATVGRRVPLSGPPYARCVASPRALSAPLRSLASSAPLRPPAPSKLYHSDAGLRACGASAIGAALARLRRCLPLKGGRPRSPFAPLVRPFGALRVPCLFGFRLFCRAGLRGGGVERRYAPGRHPPPLLARERDFTLMLP